MQLSSPLIIQPLESMSVRMNPRFLSPCKTVVLEFPATRWTRFLKSSNRLNQEDMAAQDSVLLFAKLSSPSMADESASTLHKAKAALSGLACRSTHCRPHPHSQA